VIQKLKMLKICIH